MWLVRCVAIKEVILLPFPSSRCPLEKSLREYTLQAYVMPPSVNFPVLRAAWRNMLLSGT